MIHPRSLLSGVVAATLLAACSQEQVVDTGVAQQLRVVDTSVVVATKRVKDGFKHDLPTDQIEQIVRNTVLQRLQGASSAGSRAVEAEIEITSIYIANPVLGALFGGSSSNMNATMTVVDVETGEPVSIAIPLFGTTPPRPTIIGAAVIRSPDKEVAIVANNLAEKAEIAIFGE